MQLIQLGFDKIERMRTYTTIVLKSSEKKFAIYVASNVGETLQMYLTDAEKARPQTHDFISNLFKGLEIQVKHLIINDVQDTIFYARLFLEQMRGDIKHVVEVDGRPSDFITLVLMHNAPVYCTIDVHDKVIPIVD